MQIPRPALAWLFLLFAVPVLIFDVIAVPAGEVPDEPAHILRAASLLHGEVLGHRELTLSPYGGRAVMAGVDANLGLLAAGFAFPSATPLAAKHMDQAKIAALLAIPWAARPAFAPVSNTAVYPPTLYLAAAFGLGLGHVVGLGPYLSILLARLCDTTLYITLGFAALALARRGRPLLFAALLLPMSLWLGASVSQDGLLLPVSCLAAALLSRADAPQGRAYWGAALLLACVIAAKPPYMPLAGVMVLPGLAEDGGWRLGRRLAGMALAALPGLFWLGLTLTSVATPLFRGPPYIAGPLWPGTPGRVFATMEPAAQSRVLLHQPMLALSLPWAALQHEAAVRFHELIGVLGLLAIELPPWLRLLWTVAFGTALMATMFARRAAAPGPRWWTVAAMLGLVTLCIFAIYDAEYLIWTPVGAAAIEGVQGRYALPLLPFQAVLLPRFRLGAGDALRALLTLPAVAAGAVGLVAMPAIVLFAYYIR